MVGEEDEQEKPEEDVVEKFLSHELKDPQDPRESILYPVPEKEVMPSREEQLEKLKDKMLLNIGKQTKLEENPIIGEGGVKVIKPEFQSSLSGPTSIDSDETVWSAGQIDPKLEPKESEFKTYDELMDWDLPISGKVEEIVENEVKRRIREIEDKKGIEKANEFLQQSKDILQEAKDSLDEEAERLTPKLDLPIETKVVQSEVTQIPVDIVPEMGEPEIVIPKDIQKQAEDSLRRELGEKIPFTKTRGWHLKKTYVDSNGDVYHFGKISDDKELKEKPKEPKKA
jgi:hypothetical protein